MSTAVPKSATSAGVKPQAASNAGFRNSMRHWLAPITLMTFVLGGFIGLALKTQNVVRHDDLPSSRYSGLAEAYLSMKTMMAYQATIGSLQRTNAQLTENASTHRPNMRVLDDEVKQARFMAGLTDVEGPGIVVTLNDSAHRPADNSPAGLSPQIVSNYIIHDVDIQRVLNELKAGGAEAFSVNNQRVITTTPVRCVGPAIQVNGVPITPPYRIRAIGDPDTLATAMNLPGGIADQIKSIDSGMISITKSQKFVIPAYNGAMQFRYAKPHA